MSWVRFPSGALFFSSKNKVASDLSGGRTWIVRRASRACLSLMTSRQVFSFCANTIILLTHLSSSSSPSDLRRSMGYFNTASHNHGLREEADGLSLGDCVPGGCLAGEHLDPFHRLPLPRHFRTSRNSGPLRHRYPLQPGE